MPHHALSLSVTSGFACNAPDAMRNETQASPQPSNVELQIRGTAGLIISFATDVRSCTKALNRKWRLVLYC